MAKILIVGGAGYIGGLVTDYAIESGHEVTVYDNLLYEERFFKPVRFIFGDVVDTSRLVDLAKEYDYVIWLAALVGDPACQINPELTEQINHRSVKNFCKENKIPMIFFSTCSVYGIAEGLLNEESKTNPLSAYASTKLAAEKHVLKNNGCVFRLGTVFGLGDPWSRIRLDLVVNVMTMKAVTDRKIVVNGGSQWRPIIAVKDIARYVMKCLDNFQSGIYIISSENVIIKDLASEVAKIIPGVEIEYNDLPFQDQRNYCVDNSKAIKAFGYSCQTTVEEEVIRIHNLIVENRVKDLYSPTYHNGMYIKLFHSPV